MIIQLHTPAGIVIVDSDTVADQELADLNVTRANLEASLPQDLAQEITELKADIVAIKTKVGLPL